MRNPAEKVNMKALRELLAQDSPSWEAVHKLVDFSVEQATVVGYLRASISSSNKFICALRAHGYILKNNLSALVLGVKLPWQSLIFFRTQMTDNEVERYLACYDEYEREMNKALSKK